MANWSYRWLLDMFVTKKATATMSDLEKVRYQIQQARVECTITGERHIVEEILYLTNWYFYFDLLTKSGQFDPECLKYFQLEIIRLYKERNGWM